MGGIFGLVGWSSPEAPEAMSRQIAHRGAASDIRAAADGVSLGVRFDPGEASVAERGRYSIAADAMLFPRPAPGARNTDIAPEDGDIGLLVDTYHHAGIAGLAQINGEFAFALWDDHQQELVLVRDFTGALPLYITELPQGGIAFASEYKAFLAIPDFKADVDLDMLQYLQNHKYLPSQRTLLKGVEAVPAGTAIGFSRSGALLWRKCMPSLNAVAVPMSLEHAREGVADAFMEAMQSRVRGPMLGVALSGGIDSIGVACAARKLRRDVTIHTYTAGHGPDDPEVRTAEYVAAEIGAVHHNVFVKPEHLGAMLHKLVWHLETPIARTEALQFLQIGEAASGTVGSMLTGVVSDGLFAGNPKHKLLWLMQKLPVISRPLAEFYTLTQSGRPPQGVIGKLMEYAYFRGAVPDVPRIIGSGYSPDLTVFDSNTPEFINDVTRLGLQESIASWLPKIERPLRAAGIHYTSPFFDRRLMEYSFKIPSEYKIRRGVEKYVLRAALRTIVPDKVLNIPKFPMKMRHDLGFSEALDSVADVVLSSERVARRGWMADHDVRLLRRRQSGRPYSSEAAMRLWTAVLTEIWGEQFLDRRYSV